MLLARSLASLESLERFTFCHRRDKFLRNACAIRYYHHVPEHDIHEALSEEDIYASQMLKNPPRKSSGGYYQNWISQRNSADRYDTNEQPSRRARTRPEVKSFMEAEFIDRRKCSRCGNISSRKPSASRRDAYRYQNNPNFSAKGHFGKRVAKFPVIPSISAYVKSEAAIFIIKTDPIIPFERYL